MKPFIIPETAKDSWPGRGSSGQDFFAVSEITEVFFALFMNGCGHEKVVLVLVLEAPKTASLTPARKEEV